MKQKGFWVETERFFLAAAVPCAAETQPVGAAGTQRHRWASCSGCELAAAAVVAGDAKKTYLLHSTQCTELSQKLSAFDLGSDSSAYSQRFMFGQAEAFMKRQLLLRSSPPPQSLLRHSQHCCTDSAMGLAHSHVEGLSCALVLAVDVTLRIDGYRRRGSPGQVSAGMN